MKINKSVLPENEGTFFIAVRDALHLCKDLLENYSKEKSKIFLENNLPLWNDAHFMIVGEITQEFDLDNSMLVEFHDAFMELAVTVDLDGFTLE